MKATHSIAILAVLALAGCVSTPSEKGVEPRKKERVETVRIPVLIKEASYFADGVLDRTVTYSYDASLKTLLERRVQEPSRSEPTERTVYEYSGDKPVSVTVLDSDGKIRLKTELTTNAAGLVVREAVADAKGTLQTSSQFEYDAAGLRVRRRVFDGAGVLLAVSEYAYASGRLSVIIMKDAAERPAGRIEHGYDAEGRLTSRVTFDPAGAISQRERFTYKNGALTEERTERGDGRVERQTVYQIGPDGTPLKSTLYDGAGRVREVKTYEHAFRTEERVVYYE